MSKEKKTFCDFSTFAVLGVFFKGTNHFDTIYDATIILHNTFLEDKVQWK